MSQDPHFHPSQEDPILDINAQVLVRPRPYSAPSVARCLCVSDLEDAGCLILAPCLCVSASEDSGGLTLAPRGSVAVFLF